MFTRPEKTSAAFVDSRDGPMWKLNGNQRVDRYGRQGGSDGLGTVLRICRVGWLSKSGHVGALCPPQVAGALGSVY